jgi:hypothetical protein
MCGVEGQNLAYSKLSLGILDLVNYEISLRPFTTKLLSKLWRLYKNKREWSDKELMFILQKRLRARSLK